MALFLVLALDKPDVLALRAATRPAHLDFVRFSAHESNSLDRSSARAAKR